MVYVYEGIPLVYIYSVIDRTYNQELLTEYGWAWLNQAVQTNKLQVTSDGRWLADPDETGEITLTPQGRVMLVPQDRASPTDRGLVPFDMCPKVRLLVHLLCPSRQPLTTKNVPS